MLLVCKYKIIVLEVQCRTTITRIKHRTTTLTRKLADEHIVLHTLDYQKHATFNTLFLLERHIRPTQRIDILLYALFQRVKY